MPNTLASDCPACRAPFSVFPNSYARYSVAVRVIGIVSLVLSVLGIAFVGLMLLVFVVNSAGSSGGNDADKAFRWIVEFCGVVIALVVFVASLIGGLVGWVLLTGKKSHKCQRCGFVLDRDKPISNIPL